MGAAQGVSRWPVHREVTLQLWLQRGEARSKKLLNMPPGPPSAAPILLGTAGPFCSAQRCFLPTWVPAQVRTGRSDRALAEGAGTASAPTALAATAQGRTDSGENHHMAAPSGNLGGVNKQSQFNSYFGEHRPTWGAVHAATASIPHQTLPAWGPVTGPPTAS